MGMFQPQNYGADFVGGMTATANMLNDSRRTDLLEKQQARDAQTHDLQDEGMRLENQKRGADLEREKNLSDFMGLTGRMQSGQLAPEDYERLTGVTKGLLKDTPYLPSDPKYIPQYKASINNLIQGVEQLRTLPASNYRYTRDDNVPEVNSVLDSFQTLLSKDRLGKEFTDKDGSVTGKIGETYKTAGVGGFTMVSGEGNKAAFTPLFSVTDKEGKPIVGADGRAVMVPSTEGHSNDPNAQVKMITPEEMLTKAGFAYRVLDTADKLGLADSDKRKDYVTQNMPQYMGEKGAEQVLKNNMRDTSMHAYPTDQDIYNSKGELVRAATPKDKFMAVPEGGKLVEPSTGKVVAEGNPKNQTPHTTVAGVGGGMEQTFQYNPDTKKYDIPVGKPTAKHKASEGSKDGTAKVGTINAVKAALVRRYIPVAKNELSRQGKTDTDMAPTDSDKALGLHVSASAVYGALGDTGRQAYDRAATLAEQYASTGKMTPENAVEKALTQVRQELSLGSDGTVRGGSPQTAAKPKSKGMGARTAQAATTSGLSPAARKIAGKY